MMKEHSALASAPPACWTILCTSRISTFSMWVSYLIYFSKITNENSSFSKGQEKSCSVSKCLLFFQEPASSLLELWIHLSHADWIPKHGRFVLFYISPYRSMPMAEKGMYCLIQSLDHFLSKIKILWAVCEIFDLFIHIKMFWYQLKIKKNSCNISLCSLGYFAFHIFAQVQGVSRYLCELHFSIMHIWNLIWVEVRSWLCSSGLRSIIDL